MITVFGKFLKVQCSMCVGGTSLLDELQLTHYSSHIIVGTLHRVNELINCGALSTDAVIMFVVDNADKVSPFTLKKIQKLHKRLPTNVQVALFCDTLPSDLLAFGTAIMSNQYQIIRNSTDNKAVPNIKQYYITVDHKKEKPKVVVEICEKLSPKNSPIIVVCKRRHIKKLSTILRRHFFTVLSLGNTLNKREQGMIEFREGLCRLLVYNNLCKMYDKTSPIQIVLNYHLSSKRERYIRR